MNIKKMFKKEKKNTEEKKPSFIDKHLHNEHVQLLGLDMMMSMPKWQQKAAVRAAIKNKEERAMVLKVLRKEIPLQDYKDKYMSQPIDVESEEVKKE